MIATDSDKHKAGLFRVYVDNIQITDGDCTLLSIYKDEENVPITGTPTASDTTFAGTAGTKDFSVSVVGQTPVEPAGKLTSTWGNIKK
jgi:IMP cyclohydrolase